MPLAPAKAVPCQVGRNRIEPGGQGAPGIKTSPMGVEPDEGLEREVPGILGIPNPADQVGVKRNTVPLDDTFERGVLIGEEARHVGAVGVPFRLTPPVWHG